MFQVLGTGLAHCKQSMNVIVSTSSFLFQKSVTYFYLLEKQQYTHTHRERKGERIFPLLFHSPNAYNRQS